MQLKYQPQPRLFKLVILYVDGLLCSHYSLRVRWKAIMHFNGFNNLGRDKFQVLKVCPRLWEFMSVLIQNFHIHVWSCMKDVVLHNVLRHLFSQNVIRTLAFVWSISKCTNTNGFISRDISFLLKHEIFLFKHHKNMFGCKDGNICSLMINLVNTLGTRPQNVVIFPTLDPVLVLQIISPPLVISTLRNLYTHQMFFYIL